MTHNNSRDSETFQRFAKVMAARWERYRQIDDEALGLYQLFLALYRATDKPYPVLAACACLSRPQTVALRMIDAGQAAGYFRRVRDPKDARRIFLMPTDKLIEFVERSFRAEARARTKEARKSDDASSGIEFALAVATQG